MFENTATKMFLYNYYIDNGSFMNLSKKAPAIYRKVLQTKKEENVKDLTVTEYLERKLLTYKKDTDLDTGYIRRLYEHYTNNYKLVGTDIPRQLEMNLRSTAEQLGVDLERVKEMFDNYEVYPEVTNKILNRIDIRDYNNIMSIIGLNLFMDMQVNSNIRLEWYNDFDDFAHLRSYEPSYATYLETRVPKYSGPIKENSGASIIVEGSRYYGKNLRLETVKTLLNDIFFTLKGYSADKNVTPTIYYKLDRMIKSTGNLNRIGLDDLNLLEELDELSMSLGFKSIRELLIEEGFKFEPISAERVNFIDNGDNYELILSDYEPYQIIIDPVLKKYITDMNLEQTLQVLEVPYKNTKVSLLVYEYEGKSALAHSLITKSNSIKFNDGNSLNLTTKNLIGSV